MIEVTLFGYGYWGKILYKEFEKSGLFRIKHVIDPFLSVEDELFLNSSHVTINMDYQKIVTKVGIIATPAVTHFELVKDLIKLGWDILCEKPLCTDANESEILVNLAREKQTVLAVGHTYLHNDAVKRIKIELDSMANRNGLGLEANSLISYRLAPGPIRMDVGAHWDLAAHDVSVFLFLMGSKEPTISEVRGFRRSHKKVWDFISITLVDERNNKAFIQVGWLSPVKIRQLQVYTQGLSVQYDEVENPNSLKVVKFDDPLDTQVIHLDGVSSPVQNEMAYFYDRIKRRSLEDFQVEIAQKVVEILGKVEKLLVD